MSTSETADMSVNQELLVDYRSDTVTVPTNGMKKAMMEAVVGDDVMQEDPTTKELEEYVAELCGKEAGLFVPTLCMGNQICAKVHTVRRPELFKEVIVDKRAHMYCHELSGLAVHSHIQAKPLLPLEGERHLTAEQIESEIHSTHDFHTPITTLILVENPLGGVPMTLEHMQAIYAVAQAHGVQVHADGARVWNSVAATGTTLKEYYACVDSAALCLSKGLGAPCGAVIVGDKDFVDICREARKSMGGGMRQAGMLAAAGLYGIKEHWPLMEQDHARAKTLAKGLRSMGFKLVDAGGVAFDEDQEPDTNVVFVDSTELGLDWAHAAQELKDKHGVVIDGMSGYGNRLVTHYQITDEHIDMLLDGLRELVGAAKEEE